MNVPTRLDSALARDLRMETGRGKLRIAEQWIADASQGFHREAMDLIAGELTSAFADTQEELRGWTASLPESIHSAYLRAVVGANSDDAAAVCALWERFAALDDLRDPLLLVAYARALADAGRFEPAAFRLRRALEQRPPYVFYPRAARLIERVASNVQSWLRECRVAVLGNNTTNLLLPVLKALLFRDRIKAEFYEGLYGSSQQEILDPGSGLAAFRPNIVFLVSGWRDLRLPATLEHESEFIDGAIEQAKARWQRLSGQFGCHIVEHACDFPVEESYGYLASSLKNGRSRAIELLNRRVIEEAPSYVSILDAPAIQRSEGSRWQDDTQWHSFRQQPSSEALPALAEAMAAHARAALGLTKKVLVTDLDNTLWQGVIGEDGLSGIKIGPGSPAGEAHTRLQQYMLELKSRGILLAVASKNNHEDACLPFLKHEQMLLRMEDFAAFEANWNDKAHSIREIARKLSLGLDSFVFLDDNPLEREWVRSQIPEVAVVDLGPSVFHYVQDLDRSRHFFTLSLSAEDQARAEQYRSEAARKTLQVNSESLDDFLKQLQLRARVEPVNQQNLARVTQLTNKTNQFNLTTRRYTEAQVEQLAGDPAAWTAAFHLADKMGDYGLTGVIFCRPAEAGAWEIDTWLMSCRVLGRQMEKFMFDRLIEAAQARGIREIIGVFRPTAKNSLVRDLYPRFGFEQCAESSAEVRYTLAVPEDAVATATHVRNLSEIEKPADRSQLSPAAR